MNRFEKRLDRLDAELAFKRSRDWEMILGSMEASKNKFTDEELETLGDALESGEPVPEEVMPLVERLDNLPFWEYGDLLASLLQSGFKPPESYAELFADFGLMPPTSQNGK